MVYIYRQGQVNENSSYYLAQQIKIIVVRGEKNDTLKCYRSNVRALCDKRYDVAFLLNNEYGLLVCHKVRSNIVEEKQEEQQL